MFVYQRKINNKDGIVFVGDSVDQGKQLPIINGPAYAVYETEEGKIVAESVEFVDGEIDDKSKYFYEVLITQPEDPDFKLTPLPKNYVVSSPIIGHSDISYHGLGDLIVYSGEQPPMTGVPVITGHEDMISARTSSGHDLTVDVQWFGEDIDIGFVMVTQEGDPIPGFYDKVVEDMPATDITISCGDSTITVTYVFDIGL